jgi:hypothetical protein
VERPERPSGFIKEAVYADTASFLLQAISKCKAEHHNHSFPFDFGIVTGYAPVIKYL